jgi:hypothetical protein
MVSYPTLNCLPPYKEASLTHITIGQPVEQEFIDIIRRTQIVQDDLPQRLSLRLELEPDQHPDIVACQAGEIIKVW